MKKIKIEAISKILILILGILFTSTTLKAQLNTRTVKDQFSLNEAPILSEQLNLHIDRTDYIAGEAIWFKAYYLMNNQMNKNQISKVLYLELVDNNGISIAKGKYKIDTAGADGSLQIPSTLLSGYYTLYAYTKWMRNMGNSSYYKISVFIVNPEKSIYTYLVDSIKDKLAIVNFYPEGGRLIAGYKNTITYTVNTKNGDPIEMNGQIVDQNNTLITEFKSSVGNLNQFTFVPKADGQYRAILKRKDKSNLEIYLPKVENIGLAIRCENETDEFIKIQFESNENTPLVNKKLKLEIECNGFVYKTIETSLTKTEYSEIILKKDLISGSNKITVINLEGIKLFEKYITIPLDDEMNIEIKTDKTNYSKREKVSLSLTTSNKTKMEKNSHLSISVSKSKIETEDQADKEILAAAFNNYNKIAKTINDSINHKNEIEFLPETQGIILSGRVNSKNLNQAASNVSIYLSAINNQRIVQNTVTNSEGKFYFNLDGLVDKSELVVQLADQTLSGYQIDFENEYSADYTGSKNRAISSDEYQANFYKSLLTNYQIQKQYDAINNKDSIKGSNNINIFYGKPDSTYYLKKYIDLPTLEDFFNEIVGNVQVKMVRDSYEIFINSGNTSQQLILAPLLLVDGVPIFINSKFLKIPPVEIEKIEIINSVYILGETKYGGIISLFSKNENLANIASSSSFTFYQFDGYAPKTAFKAIDYSKKEFQETRIPDFRNTLYWNPNLVTDEKGMAEISFYTSDELGKYLITVDGYSSDGKIGSKQIIIEVGSL